MTLDPGDALVSALHDHNPWWEDGVDAFSLPARQRSDFYHLARPEGTGSQVEDQPILGLVGRRGVGKTTLLKQFIQHRIAAGDEPERFLYLPFDADPLYQLQSDSQLRRAVRYYESRIFGRIGTTDPHFILLDDVHRIEHPNKPTIDGWGTPLAELLKAIVGDGSNQHTFTDLNPRHVVVTASAQTQIERELERVGIEPAEYHIQRILPEKFRDYLFTLYPSLERGDTRISPSSLRSGPRGIPTTLQSGDILSLVDELRTKHAQVSDEGPRIQSQVVDYLSMGGIISYDHTGAVGSAADLEIEDYHRLRESVRDSLYQEVPDFDSIQTIADLERLCALAARNRAVEPFRYQELVELFDVDRRTIADSYLPALSELSLLTGVTEYDNSRPRAVKLYLRDTGLVTALADGDASTARSNFEREADLARVAAFGHTMRFSYGINAAQDIAVEPSVQYWQGRKGEVDFVFEVNDTPVPIGFAYRSRNREQTYAAVEEFMQSYDAPLGFLLAGETVRGAQSVEHLGNGIVELPYWLYLLLC